MAEGIFNKTAREKGLPYFATSCGCATYGGEKVSENSLFVCREIGVELSPHISRGLKPQTVDIADKIIPMGEGHYNIIKLYFPKIETMEKPFDVSDPFGSDEKTYRKCRDEIEEKIEKLFEDLERENSEESQSDFSIAFAGKKDTKIVEKLGEKYFHDFWDEDTFENYIENPHLFFLKCCNKKGEIIAYICSRIVCETAEIDRVVVEENYRGLGIAKSLISEFEKIAKAKGVFEILLEVRKSNFPAQSLYKKCGFLEITQRRNYYSNPTEDAVIMRKDI